nr:MAG TPA: hypothetical protein [Caudoviricetes sp.]
MFLPIYICACVKRRITSHVARCVCNFLYERIMI